jgi:type IV pilus assembly protein PilM
MAMSLLARFRAAPAPLPPGAVIGHRWGALGRQRQTGVGIDFGAGAVKVAQVRWTRQGPRLENYAIVPLPPGQMEEGAIRNPAAMAELLRAIDAHMGLAQPLVGTMVGGPAILMRHINLPRVAPADMRAAMKFEAPQHLPIAEEQLVYDFTPVPEAAGVPEHQVAVFLAGTHKRLVDTHLATLQQAGLRCNAIELDCLAVLRALQCLGAVNPDSPLPLILLDVGEQKTSLHILRHGVPMLSRSIVAGLGQLRTIVMDTLAVPLADAEQLLRTRGVRPDAETAAAVEPWLWQLLEAVGRSVEYFLIQHRGASLDRVFLTGGGALLPGLDAVLGAYLERSLAGRSELGQLRVEPVGLCGLDVNPALLPAVAQYGPLLLGALGSAMREGAPV